MTQLGDGIGDLSLLQRRKLVRSRGRDRRGWNNPLDLAALLGAGTFGVVLGELRKVLATARPVDQALRLLAGRAQLLFREFLGGAQQLETVRSGAAKRPFFCA